MRKTFEHTFDAPIDDVVRADLDPDYQARLATLPNVAERTVTALEHDPDGVVRRTVRYRLDADLPAAVTTAIGADSVSWDEVGTFDPSDNTWTAEIRPQVFAGRFTGRARVVYGADGDRTRRSMSVEVAVRVPIVGGRVEKAIIEGLSESVEAEAECLASFVQERRQTA